MYASLGPGQMIDLDTPSPNGMDLIYTHDYVARRSREWTAHKSGKKILANMYEYCDGKPLEMVDPLGLWGWDADYLQYGVGGLLGLRGLESASESWSAASQAYSRAGYGVVGTLTGGLFDSDYAFGGRGDSWYQRQDEVSRFVKDAGYGDLQNDPGYSSGATGARVAEVAILAAGAVIAAESAGLIDTSVQGNNVFRIMCKPLKRGLRLDKPHHGKWYHWHWWKW